MTENEEDTSHSMLPPHPVVPERRRWYRNRAAPLVAVVGLLVALGLGYVMVPAQWVGRILPGNSIVDDGAVALKPGSARPTDEQVVVSGLMIFEPEGEILLTTVSIDNRVTIRDWVRSVREDSVVLRTKEQVYGPRSADEQRERNLQLMAASKDSAIIAALDHLGVVAVVESGVGFNGIVSGGPVDGLIEVGELIVGLDGRVVTGLESLLVVLEQVSPGDQGVLTLEDLETGQLRSQAFVYGTHPDPARSSGFIGIEDITIRSVDAELPFDIEIASGSIGGPSAGLAFTLTILDLLTEGELTGGARVAVTGTITGDGTVGNVGGVAQKAAAAEAEGAVMFIVPADTIEAAASTTTSLEIVGVTSLAEALEALASLGGDVDDLALDGSAFN
ncbi:MAG: S16 family serine protease [Acidimicrobiales bacterium]